MTALLVFLGAGLGGVMRYGIGRLIVTPEGAIPRATLLVNISGSLLIGLFAAMAQSRGISSQAQAFLIVGVCGGYTTFSAFSAETLSLVQSAQWGRATTYALTSVVLCVLAALAGLRLGGNVIAPDR